ncbi:hypothetical protein GDO81_016446 [Engystomops pustulosus]|uniref:Uncharacterized protein n=1 Tax=Engystomops pustulosus TaxID=76066 RepID=A0AAV7AWQ3_ENGPU|nr:hypothetical protein GDO81_016446 [Engystomops pustulosus]
MTLNLLLRTFFRGLYGLCSWTVRMNKIKRRLIASEGQCFLYLQKIVFLFSNVINRYKWIIVSYAFSWDCRV